jgi:hypothetical protein
MLIMTHPTFHWRTFYSLFFIFTLISCGTSKEDQSSSIPSEEEANPFVGAWLLDHVTQEDSSGTNQIVDVFSKGLIMYSEDGYMSAILTYSEDYGNTPGLDVGYCGRYEFNTEETSISHLRDVIAINADTENEVFVRDYSFSADNNLLTLSPREDTWKGTSLTWKRVE